MKRELLAVQKRLIAESKSRSSIESAGRAQKLRTGKAANQELRAKRADNPQKSRQKKGANPVVAQHVDGFGVVAEQRRAAPRRSPPQRLPAERELVVGEAKRNVALQNSPARDPRNRPRRRGRREIGSCDLLLRKRVRRRSRCRALELRANET